jgi:hypothetical protein
MHLLSDASRDVPHAHGLARNHGSRAHHGRRKGHNGGRHQAKEGELHFEILVQ